MAAAPADAVTSQVWPQAGDGFVLTPPLEDLVERALGYLKAGYAINLAGPAGTGKTTLALHLAARLGQPASLIHGDDEFGSSDLVGNDHGYRKSKLVDNFIHSVVKTEETMKTLWTDNRLTTACRFGHVLIYDEFTRSRPEANNVLLSVLGERLLSLPKQRNGGEGYLDVHPDFRAIFTSNPLEYAGVHKSQDALHGPLDHHLHVALRPGDGSGHHAGRQRHIPAGGRADRRPLAPPATPRSGRSAAEHPRRHHDRPGARAPRRRVQIPTTASSPAPVTTCCGSTPPGVGATGRCSRREQLQATMREVFSDAASLSPRPAAAHAEDAAAHAEKRRCCHESGQNTTARACKISTPAPARPTTSPPRSGSFSAWPTWSSSGRCARGSARRRPSGWRKWIYNWPTLPSAGADARQVRRAPARPAPAACRIAAGRPLRHPAFRRFHAEVREPAQASWPTRPPAAVQPAGTGLTNKGERSDQWSQTVGVRIL